MRFSAIGIFAFMLAMIFFTAPVKAQETIGRGYSVVDYRSLVKSYFGLYKGGNPSSEMIDNYAQLAYCDLYKKHFEDDFKWASIQDTIKEEFRSHHNNINYSYEVVGDLPIERYNFKRKSFPIKEDYQLHNVGRLAVYSPTSYFAYCGETGFPKYLPAFFSLSVSTPINIMEVPIPEEKAKQIINHIHIVEGQRTIFVRFRMEFLDYKTLNSQDRAIKAQFHGNITAIDFFLDPQLTQKVYTVDLDRMY
jgi:hypothetical protein